MKKTFGQHLRQRMDAAGINSAELSRLSGVTKQNIGRLLNATPHPVSGAPPTTTRETVEKLAPHLGWDLADALISAGIVPDDREEYSLGEGIEISFDDRKFTKDEQRQFVEAIKTLTQTLGRRGNADETNTSSSD